MSSTQSTSSQNKCSCSTIVTYLCNSLRCLLSVSIIAAFYIIPSLILAKNLNIKNNCNEQTNTNTFKCVPGVNQSYQFNYAGNPNKEVTISANNTTVIVNSNTISFYNPEFGSQYIKGNMISLSGYVYSDVVVKYISETNNIYDVQTWLNSTYDDFDCCIISNVGYNVCPVCVGNYNTLIIAMSSTTWNTWTN
jgi:hypothetical protein